jgi:hypothetical protein
MHLTESPSTLITVHLRRKQLSKRLILGLRPKRPSLASYRHAPKIINCSRICQNRYGKM